MNTKFNLGEIKIKSETHDVDVHIGGLEIEVTDLNLTQYVQLLKEMPSLIKELKEATEEPTVLDLQRQFDRGYQAGKHEERSNNMRKERAQKEMTGVNIAKELDKELSDLKSTF